VLPVSRPSRQCGILNISQPYRPPRPVTGIALLFFTCFFHYSIYDKEPHEARPDVVEELKKQLREKDLVLTDIRLEALSSAHQLESLKDTVIKMRVSEKPQLDQPVTSLCSSHLFICYHSYQLLNNSSRLQETLNLNILSAIKTMHSLPSNLRHSAIFINSCLLSQ
jgi:hypothetical protein